MALLRRGDLSVTEVCFEVGQEWKNVRGRVRFELHLQDDLGRRDRNAPLVCTSDRCEQHQTFKVAT
jgi:hypothetical protein